MMYVPGTSCEISIEVSFAEMRAEMTRLPVMSVMKISADSSMPLMCIASEAGLGDRVIWCSFAVISATLIGSTSIREPQATPPFTEKSSRVH